MLEDILSEAEEIQREMEAGGLVFDLRRVETREAFVGEFMNFEPNIVLSNYQLEGFDGLTALEISRNNDPNIPFIFVSWMIHEESLIDVMKRGATDYVFKDQLSRLPISIQRALREAQERAELHQSQTRMVEQERLGAMGQMASGIAHDFGNALTPVLGYSELLISYPENRENKEKLDHFLKMINLAAKDAMSLVGRLREFYRPRKKIESFEPLDLQRLVEETIDLTNPKWGAQAMAAGITIQFEKKFTDLPKISGNQSALRDVFTNLIFNAVDAMPQGGTITFEGHTEPYVVCLEVSDTGGGMSEEVRRHCFDPFFSTKGIKGTGLGLAMVYGMIRRHEGTIDIKSEVGKGTTFIIRLPQYIGVKHLAPTEGMPSRPPRPAKSLRCLVVDDEVMVRSVIREYLTSEGHSVETAGSGAEALEKFEIGKFDVVLTDWAMPGMTGDRLAIRLKELSSSLPIIMLTGFGELIKAKGQQPAGVDILLSKPPTLDAMREAILEVFSV